MSFNFGVDLHDFGIRAGYLPFIGDRFGIAGVGVVKQFLPMHSQVPTIAIHLYNLIFIWKFFVCHTGTHPRS